MSENSANSLVDPRGMSPSICLSHSSSVMYECIARLFSSLFLFSNLDFSECVLSSHQKVSVTTGISFRSHQAETGLSGGENSRSIKAFSAATAALIGTGSQITPTEVIRQEVLPWEMDLNVTGHQTATGLLSFLTQTGSQWPHVHSITSPTQSLRYQRFSGVTLHLWEMPAVCQGDGDLSVSPEILPCCEAFWHIFVICSRPVLTAPFLSNITNF